MLVLVFNEEVATADPAVGDLVVEGVNTQRRRNVTPGVIDGNAVTFGTNPVVGSNLPPPRLAYSPTSGSIEGASGRVLGGFSDRPVQIVP